MIDNQEKHTLYGREQESKLLQRIVESVRCWGTYNDDDAQTTDDIRDVPIFRKGSVDKTSISHDMDIHRNYHNNYSSFVLIHGPRGSGKKQFAYQTLQNMNGCLSDSYAVASEQIGECNSFATNNSYILLSGQYRPVRRRSPNMKQRMADERPFAAFDEAIVGLMGMISKNESVMNAIRENLMKIVISQSEIDVLVTAFPCMDGWIRDPNKSHHVLNIKRKSKSALLDDLHTPGVSSLDFSRTLQGTQLMEQQVLVRGPAMIHFIQAVLHVVPLIILLKDVHYADTASISLIETLICNKEAKQRKWLLIVATYHSDDVGLTSDKLLSFVSSCQVKCTCSRKCKLCTLINSEKSQGIKLPESDDSKHGTTINIIILPELKWDDVHTWIQTSKIFQTSTLEEKKHLSDLVYHHSYGIPLRVQYIILYLESESFRDEINKKSLPRSLGEMYSIILLRQCNPVQDIVKVAAALIHSGLDGVSIDMLEIASGQPCIDQVVQAAGNKLLQFEQVTNTIKFSHADFQEAAYNVIPVEDRPLFHLAIGRRIWKLSIMLQDYVQTGPIATVDSSTKVLLATLQLRNSISLLSDINERVYMSQLCYESGHTLVTSGDYLNASKIFDFAICVLGSEIWSDKMYEAGLALHNAAVQAYCYSGDIDAMENALDAIFDNARSFHDQIPAYIALIYAQGIKHQLVEAVRTISVALNGLGEPLNQNPTSFDVMKQMTRTQWMLHRKVDKVFGKLPVLENEKYLITTQLLSFAIHYTFIKSPEMCLIACCRVLQLTYMNGISGPSAMALSAFGCFFTGSGKFDQGYSYGQLAIRLVDQFEAWIPRTYLYFYGYITHWVFPIRESIEPLKHAAHVACKFGDMESYGVCSCFYVISMFYSGSSLSILEKICRTVCESDVDVGYNNVSLIFISTLSFLIKLTGSSVPIRTTNDVKDAESALKYSIKDGNKFYVGRYYLEQTIWYYLVGEYITALNFVKKAKTINPISEYNLPFYEGLLEFAYTWTCTSYVQRQKHKYQGCKIVKVLKKWSKQCPANFENKYLLLLAEYNALIGHYNKALNYFDKSITRANEEGFTSEVAISYERLGRYQLYLNKKVEATVSLERAKQAYAKWGSKPLCRRIDCVLLTIG